MPQNIEVSLDHLEQVIKEVISEATGVQVSMLRSNVLLFPELAAEFGLSDAADLGLVADSEVNLDSLDVLDILVGVEEHFGVQYDINDLQSGEVSPMSLASTRLIAEYLTETLSASVIAEGIGKWEARGGNSASD